MKSIVITHGHEMEKRMIYNNDEHEKGNICNMSSTIRNKTRYERRHDSIISLKKKTGWALHSLE